ncbi:MAG: biotin--[acetyl-CoA-carboxylase] ligase, partial [Bacteroidales bacterium]|nr:biotin--[acetyl-CoA-carboxylase] ligase [Bacteroidales bacterium]
SEDFKIIKYKTVSSTNDKAKGCLQSGKPENFTVIISEEQTKGRGQRGNFWHSEKNKNLTLSTIIFPNFLPVSKQFYLSKVVSLGIIDYLNSKKQGFKIKWPNDIFYNDKKICGILIENSLTGTEIKSSIIGIGLNINQKKFPENLPDAISLKNITDKNYNIENEVNELLTFISKKYNLLKTLNFTEIDFLYHKNLYKINKLSNFKDVNGTFKGKIKGTLSEGNLIVQAKNDLIKYYNFKEIEFL